jgi:RHS repeat-associated protein
MLWEPAAGLYYARNRWYHPGTGRFLSEDPIGLAGGENLYTFAGNDPVNAADPFGLDGCDNVKFKADEGWQTVNIDGNLYCANIGTGTQALPTVTVTAPWTPAGVPWLPFAPAASAPSPIGGVGRGGGSTIGPNNGPTPPDVHQLFSGVGECVIRASDAALSVGTDLAVISGFGLGFKAGFYAGQRIGVALSNALVRGIAANYGVEGLALGHYAVRTIGVGGMGQIVGFGTYLGSLPAGDIPSLSGFVKGMVPFIETLPKLRLAVQACFDH